MADPGVYSDIAINDGDQILTYTHEGLKGKRIWKVDNLNNSNPQKTLYTFMTSGSLKPADSQSLPLRGTPHPEIVIQNAWSKYMFDQNVQANNAFCVDVVTVKAITSTQGILEAEYAVMNAVTQEPSVIGDTAPALLHIGSSVQSQATAVDADGQPIAIPYTAGDATDPVAPTLNPGQWTITTNAGQPVTATGSTFSPFKPGTPNYKTTATMQVPNTLIRFQRRETAPVAPDGLVGWLQGPTNPANDPNAPGWTIADNVYDPYLLLCTRIESVTQDNGVSYIVTYEFQVGQELPNASPSGAVLVSPAKLSQTSPPMYSSWLVGGYYIVTNGYGTYNGTPPSGTPSKIPQGQTPPDSLPFLFQVYGSTDLMGALSLT